MLWEQDILRHMFFSFYMENGIKFLVELCISMLSAKILLSRKLNKQIPTSVSMLIQYGCFLVINLPSLYFEFHWIVYRY